MTASKTRYFKELPLNRRCFQQSGGEMKGLSRSVSFHRNTWNSNGKSLPTLFPQQFAVSLLFSFPFRINRIMSNSFRRQCFERVPLDSLFAKIGSYAVAFYCDRLFPFHCVPIWPQSEQISFHSATKFRFAFIPFQFREIQKIILRSAATIRFGCIPFPFRYNWEKSHSIPQQWHVSVPFQCHFAEKQKTKNIPFSRTESFRFHSNPIWTQ